MKIAWLEGDGIGPEIMAACRLVFNAANDRFELGLSYDDILIGKEALAQQGSTFPNQALDRARQCDGIVLGPVSHFEYPTRENGYANLRPAFTRPNISSFGGHQFDLLIVRENTEGFYADRNMHQGPGEYMPTPDLALATRKVSRESCMRIARVAFEHAMKRRRQVTAVHKANVLRISDGLFLECTRAVASEFPEVVYNERIVDAMAALLIRDPSAFDVIVTTNMFGDILSDQVTEMAGGLGLAASLNAGDNHAMAQAQHGSAPDIANQGIANPVSVVSSGAMLLRWYGRRSEAEKFSEAAQAIDEALANALADPSKCTPDLGGKASSQEFSARVARLVSVAG